MVGNTHQALPHISSTIYKKLSQTNGIIMLILDLMTSSSLSLSCLLWCTPRWAVWSSCTHIAKWLLSEPCCSCWLLLSSYHIGLISSFILVRLVSVGSKVIFAVSVAKFTSQSFTHAWLCSFFSICEAQLAQLIHVIGYDPVFMFGSHRLNYYTSYVWFGWCDTFRLHA